MTGVSYMIPFVAAGGILIALAFLLGGPEVANKVNGGTFEGIKYQAVEDLSNLIVQAGYAGLLFRSAPSPSPCWSRSWPASSPTPWATGRPWSPASSPA